MSFDLGYEVFVVPALWAILLVTSLYLTLKSIKKVKTIEVDEDDRPVYRREVNKSLLKKAGIVFVAGGLFLSSLVVVPPGHRGAVYTTSGVSLEERGEGYSFIAPIIHNANMVNVREQLYRTVEGDGGSDAKGNLFAQSADFLEFTMIVGVNYIVEPDKAADIFKEVGQSYEEAIIKPAVNDIAKVVLGQYDAALIPQVRADIRADIFEQLSERLDEVGITVTFLAIEDVLGPPEWRKAIEAKEIAEERQEETNRLIEVAANEEQAELHRIAAERARVLEVGLAQIEVAEGLADAVTNDVVQYELAKQGIRYLPNTLVGDAVDILLGVDTEVE